MQVNANGKTAVISKREIMNAMNNPDKIAKLTSRISTALTDNIGMFRIEKAFSVIFIKTAHNALTNAYTAFRTDGVYAEHKDPSELAKLILSMCGVTA